MRWLTPSALALALAAAAFADEPAASSPVDDFFTRWDANKDGIVTKDECESSRLFGKNDQNADGQITREEVEAVWKAEEGSEKLTEPANPGPTTGGDKRAGKFGGGLPELKKRGEKGGAMTDDQNRMRVRRIFNRFDKNGDDTLSPEEMGAYYFEVLDLDRDGTLMQNEMAVNGKIGKEKAAAAMQYYDKDGDGMIAAGEWALPEDGTFAKADTNGDGKIAFDEAIIAMTPPAPGGGDTTVAGGGRGAIDVDAFLRDNDANGDGLVSADEFKGPKQMFGRADLNGDGSLDRAELEDASKKMAKMGMGGGDGKGARDLAGMVKRADKDGDGKVSREEWPGRPQMFDRMDKNGDGMLDDSDFGNAPPAPDSGGGMDDGKGDDMAPQDGSGEGSAPKALAPGASGGST